LDGGEYLENIEGEGGDGENSKLFGFPISIEKKREGM